jgi:hypothetical protein
MMSRNGCSRSSTVGNCWAISSAVPPALNGTTILSDGLEVRKGRLGCREMHEHQAARDVIHVHQGHAHRRPILKPVMLTAVDLDQLPKASPTRA